MKKEISIRLLLPHWPEWKIKLGDFFLNSAPLMYIGHANKLLHKHRGKKNSVLIEAISQDVGVEPVLHNGENLPKTGPVTIVANHPGGADIIATVVALSKVRKDIVILANRLICLEPLKDLVIPVDTLGRKKVDQNQIDEAYQQGKAVVFFAAGKNSRYNEKGELRDRKWRTSFLSYAKRYNSPIVLMHIDGTNSPLFYKVSKIRERYEKLKNVPLENLFQLKELLTAKGKINLTLSKPIDIHAIVEKGDSQEKLRNQAHKMQEFLYSPDFQSTDFLATVEQ
ncbi:1-acyl-sn-glycerol-3-phosphate acyltransferase [Algivirga pacifica]|uniref:Phospholipid/glycerol acyltransferase domain-containing protein n=1 Tax=Algivirga pacifica TaxID=1162670 RepID=A0ABP9D9J7_9BACT